MSSVAPWRTDCSDPGSACSTILKLAQAQGSIIARLPGQSVDAQAIWEAAETCWGFDRLMLFRVPLKATAMGMTHTFDLTRTELKLHHVIYLRVDDGGDEGGSGLDDTFIVLEHIGGSLRWQRSATGYLNRENSELLKEFQIAVAGHNIAALLHDWCGRTSDYSDNVVFAEDVVKACGLYSHLADHFETARSELTTWHEEQLARERQARNAAIASTATAAGGALLLCSVQ